MATGLIGVWYADVRSRQARDLRLFAEAIRTGGVYDGLVLPGALLLLGSGIWLIVTVYGGWAFLGMLWLAGMVMLFAFEFIEGNTITRRYFMRLRRLVKAALETSPPAPEEPRSDGRPRNGAALLNGADLWAEADGEEVSLVVPLRIPIELIRKGVQPTAEPSMLPAPNLWERLRSVGVEPVTVQPGDFTGSPLSQMLYRGARFEAAWDVEDLVTATVGGHDGYRYGFGAEVGISTGKLHPRGPVGLEGLVTYKYKLTGAGHTVSMYAGPGARRFTHKKVLSAE